MGIVPPIVCRVCAFNAFLDLMTLIGIFEGVFFFSFILDYDASLSCVSC